MALQKFDDLKIGGESQIVEAISTWFDSGPFEAKKDIINTKVACHSHQHARLLKEPDAKTSGLNSPEPFRSVPGRRGVSQAVYPTLDPRASEHDPCSDP